MSSWIRAIFNWDTDGAVSVRQQATSAASLEQTLYALHFCEMDASSGWLRTSSKIVLSDWMLSMILCNPRCETSLSVRRR